LHRNNLTAQLGSACPDGRLDARRASGAKPPEDRMQTEHRLKIERRPAPGNGPAVGISPSFSLYLDLIRFLAAGVVFLDHLASYPFSTNAPHQRPWQALISDYGDAAVVAFFVLSGYVIAHAVGRENTAAAYARSRLSRFYSVVIPALVLTLAFDTAGQWLHPEFYQIQKVLWTPPDLQGYLSSFFFINEFQAFGFKAVVPGSNGPFWSLSFEATYYLVAGLLLFAPRKIAIVASLVVLALAGRTITAMAPLWALGFVVYRASHKYPWRMPGPAPLVWALTVALMLVLPPLLGPLHWNNFGIQFPYGRRPFNRDLLLDYTIAAAFTLNILAAQRWLDAGSVLLDRPKRLIRYLGGVTFPLYAIHYPALCFFTAISPWNHASAPSLVFVTLSVAAVCAATTLVCDQLKSVLRNRLWAPARVADVAA
jgi:peptidoglycan/LPS O-acetylase OafA/YrhL